MVAEWRGLRADYPNRGKSLSWLVTEERLLTLPPKKQHLRSFGHKGQINWRMTALYDTRVALKKRELLR